MVVMSLIVAVYFVVIALDFIRVWDFHKRRAK